MSRIVVKIGSNVLTRSDGKPNVTNMSAIVDQVAYLREKGHEVILISSGAMACGRGAFTPSKDLDSVSARQLYSSIGQIRLLNFYNDLFAQYGIVIGQVLTQKENFSSRTLYLNQRACILTMVENGVVPIINENDTASLTELMFTDNDELSGMIATMTDADILIILSNVDGIYTGNPSDPDSRLIERVLPGEDVSGNVVASKSGFGRGGMGTKCGIAGKVSEEGIKVIIAKGDRRNVLIDVIESPESVPHTVFEPRKEGLSTVKRWIAHSSSFAKGRLVVDENAEKVLRGDSAVSLLPIGVIEADGEWEEGEIVNIYNPEGVLIGVGRASMGSEETKEAVGQRGGRPVVHYDYLYIE